MCNRATVNYACLDGRTHRSGMQEPIIWNHALVAKGAFLHLYVNLKYLEDLREGNDVFRSATILGALSLVGLSPLEDTEYTYSTPARL